ncbi:hypothetical protein M408DRAFT_331292 [Serendipita vermifera MAFF 305830]|uniref:AAA+ ATPase domain-containing protein n=1 Tax=Serendipita vermifera MAFF 305830 TaxID=933852 RepID=A0A0C3AYZ5_SERVB|nr:hypothetical protein M408DRAFT_331292 [Serendipita vermifera MAFF 305830]
MKHTTSRSSDLSDAFVNISFEEVPNKHSGSSSEQSAVSKDKEQSGKSKDKDAVYTDWKEEHSHEAVDPGLAFSNILRKKYAGWSLVRVTQPFFFPIHGYPELVMRPIPEETMDSSIAAFIPFARKSGRVGGVLAEMVSLGGFLCAWKSWDFLVYEAVYPMGMFKEQGLWVVHQGPPEPIYQLLTTVGSWGQELHDEVLVYDQGWWQKDASLYQEIQKADWKDVILKDQFKKAIRSSIIDFFKNKAVYKELQVPWKRGLIFYGPAGNGKTVSLKAAMHDTDNPILYVRTLTNYRGDEAAMADIFGMARRFSPCILVLEDIDSHINERNRSFFLNQLDGLDDNDGILLIATTNHLERLDNSVSNRPSRFDRKYLFDDPDEAERRLYCTYWQKKLEHNDKVSFPDSLADEIAKESDTLSFAYLKEAFVSTLVLMATEDIDFAETLKAQVKELKDQIRERPPHVSAINPGSVRCASSGELAATRELLQRLSGGEIQKGLSTNCIMPSANTGLRRWI